MNGMGFITSCDYKNSDGEIGQFTAEYDGEGHVVRTNNQGIEENGYDPHNYSESTEYLWENGNLIRARKLDNGGYDDVRYDEVSTFTYEEGRYPNPGVWTFLGNSMESDPWTWILFDEEFSYCGLLGKPTKNIPVKIVCAVVAGIEENETYLIDDVKYNGDGSINSISYRDESGSSSYSVRFAYGDASGRSYEPAAGFSPVRIGVADGSRRGRRGLLHKRLMERIAQGKAAR